MKDIWYLWPDGFMCPEEELAVHLQYRSDDVEKIEVIDYDEHLMPSNWVSERYNFTNDVVYVHQPITYWGGDD